MRMTGNRGFTLVEILVGLVMIGLLMGALIPTVLSQLQRGETNRIVEDLRAIETGAKVFRTDVSRWPSNMRQLGIRPGVSGVPNTDIFGATMPTGVINRWNGPYLDRAVADSVITTGGAVIRAPIDTTMAYGGTAYARIRVVGVGHPQAREVSRAIDGDTTVGFTNVNSQRVRWRADTLYFLMAPVQ